MIRPVLTPATPSHLPKQRLSIDSNFGKKKAADDYQRLFSDQAFEGIVLKPYTAWAGWV